MEERLTDFELWKEGYLRRRQEESQLRRDQRAARSRKKAREYAQRERVHQPIRVAVRYKKWAARHPGTPLMKKVVQQMLRRNNLPKTAEKQKYVGCTPGFLRNHLEEQFLPGMCWANYGTVWVVDHIVPLSWWDVKNHPAHLFEASHWTNLQPLWKDANAQKKDAFAS